MSEELCVGSLTISGSFDRAIQRIFTFLSSKVQDHAFIINEISELKKKSFADVRERLTALLAELEKEDAIVLVTPIDSTAEVIAFEITFKLEDFDAQASILAPLKRWFVDHQADTPLDMTLQFSDGHSELAHDLIVEDPASDEALQRAEETALEGAMAREAAVLAKLSPMEKLRNFLVGASSSLVFGMIDNGVMFLGGEMIDARIRALGFDSMTAAGLGNTMSDMVGVACGGVVFQLLQKSLGVKGDGTMRQQLVGITVGCLIPVGVKILTLL